MNLSIKDIGIPLTYIGGFMIGFSLPAYGHFRGDHIMFPLGLVIVAIGAYVYFRK
jgi:hypothetical protein